MLKKKKINGSEQVTFEILTQFYSEFLKPQFDRIINKLEGMEKKIDRNSTQIQVNSVKIDKIDDQFEGLKAEFSDTPSRKEFDQLKARVLS